MIRLKLIQITMLAFAMVIICQNAIGQLSKLTDKSILIRVVEVDDKLSALDESTLDLIYTDNEPLVEVTNYLIEELNAILEHLSEGAPEDEMRRKLRERYQKRVASVKRSIAIRWEELKKAGTVPSGILTEGYDIVPYVHKIIGQVYPECQDFTRSIQRKLVDINDLQRKINNVVAADGALESVQEIKGKSHEELCGSSAFAEAQQKIAGAGQALDALDAIIIHLDGKDLFKDLQDEFLLDLKCGSKLGYLLGKVKINADMPLTEDVNNAKEKYRQIQEFVKASKEKYNKLKAWSESVKCGEESCENPRKERNSEGQCVCKSEYVTQGDECLEKATPDQEGDNTPCNESDEVVQQALNSGDNFLVLWTSRLESVSGDISALTGKSDPCEHQSMLDQTAISINNAKSLQALITTWISGNDDYEALIDDRCTDAIKQYEADIKPLISVLRGQLTKLTTLENQYKVIQAKCDDPDSEDTDAASEDETKDEDVDLSNINCNEVASKFTGILNNYESRIRNLKSDYDAASAVYGEIRNKSRSELCNDARYSQVLSELNKIANEIPSIRDELQEFQDQIKQRLGETCSAELESVMAKCQNLIATSQAFTYAAILNYQKVLLRCNQYADDDSSDDGTDAESGCDDPRKVIVDGECQCKDEYETDRHGNCLTLDEMTTEAVSDADKSTLSCTELNDMQEQEYHKFWGQYYPLQGQIEQRADLLESLLNAPPDPSGATDPPCRNQAVLTTLASLKQGLAQAVSLRSPMEDARDQLALYGADCPDVVNSFEGKMQSLIDEISNYEAWLNGIFSDIINWPGCTEEDINDAMAGTVTDPDRDPTGTLAGGAGTEFEGDGFDNDGDGRTDERPNDPTVYTPSPGGLKEIVVKEKTISIRIYDGECEDGDVVTILINGDPFVSNLPLTTAGYEGTVTLNVGDNAMTIIAVDGGADCLGGVPIPNGAMGTNSANIEVPEAVQGAYQSWRLPHGSSATSNIRVEL